jgi:hypothetical protein
MLRARNTTPTYIAECSLTARVVRFGQHEIHINGGLDKG